MKRTNLYIIVSDFPYGLGEPFLEAELITLANSFEKITIVIADGKDLDVSRTRFSFHSKIRLKIIHPKSLKSELSSLFFLLFSSIFYKELFTILFSYRVKLGKAIIKTFFASWAIGSSFRKAFSVFLKSEEIDPNETTIYTYWLNNHAVGAAMLKKDFPGLKIVSRAHGWDCFYEVNKLKYLPLRPYLFNEFDAISFVSKKGLNYSISKIPGIDPKKLRNDYLGLESIFSVPKEKKSHLHLVSIAVIIPIKRIENIAKALALFEFEKIHWTHIGYEGSTDKVTIKLIEEILYNHPSVEYNITGEWNKMQIYDFLQNGKADLLISVSSSEGLPVSMMEAQAFGIPIISTNVGGTSEIVEDGINGIMLSSDPTIDQIKEAILTYVNIPEEDYKKQSKASIEVYKEKFMGTKNFQKFAEYLGN